MACLAVTPHAKSEGVLHGRDEERRWRAEDLEQRALDNARVLWARFVEKNRRDVEERAEQLKGISNLAALVAGFVMISYLQVCGTLHSQSAHLLKLFDSSNH